ncbi:unnamed protein product [Durusdinium trenchii]|uniref:Ion transport domain-containing protein n=1 Tax=Durusdinium trenchii TaxID=1381693 RepID=A0ABP0QSZ0_9DINO
MAKQTVTTRVKSSKLTEQHPWVEIVFRLLGSFGSTVLFGVRLVIAEFLFGRPWHNDRSLQRHHVVNDMKKQRIMAWVPVKAVGAVLAMVPLAYTGRKNLESLMSCKTRQEVLAEFTKLVSMSGPFLWFGLRCLDWELGVRAMIGALLFNFALMAWFEWRQAVKAELWKDYRWFTSQKPPPSKRWMPALEQMNSEWGEDLRRQQLHISNSACLNVTIDPWQHEDSRAMVRIFRHGTNQSSSRRPVLNTVLLLIANTTFLGFEVDDQRSAASGGRPVYVLIELFFATVFILEWLVRIHQQRRRGARSLRNIFDYTLVLVGFNDCMMTLLRPLAGTQLSRAFRVFRGLRVARSVRGVRRLSGLWFIIGGLLESLPTMGIVTLIVLTLVYALAICLTTTVAGEPLLLSFWNHGPMYTGTVGRSMLTVLQVATLDGWSDLIARPMSRDRGFGSFRVLFFVILLNFGTFNILVAIMIERIVTMATDTKERERERERELTWRGEPCPCIYRIPSCKPYSGHVRCQRSSKLHLVTTYFNPPRTHCKITELKRGL